MNGIIVVDKPPGMTSAGVVARIKKITGARKVGHTGTLDPFASGVLVCCLNKATRLARFLTQGKKRYEGVLRLGIRTDTQDLTGEIISSRSDLDVTENDVARAFQRIQQVGHQKPPAYSALKNGGRPLYELARQGTFVQKPSRPITVYRLEVTRMNLPHVHFSITCSAGTYVRTICADVGDLLGCGGHLAELRRTETGRFTLAESVSLEDMERLSAAGSILDCIVPMSLALRGMPHISADDQLVQRIRHGRPLTLEELPPVADKNSPWVKVTDNRGNLIAVLSSNKKDGVHPYACVFSGGDV